MTEDKPVTLFEEAEATRDRGLVGERRNVLTCDIGAISGEKIVLNGPSRGGKDEILDATEWLWHEIPDVSGEIDWEREYRNGTQWYHWPSEISPKAPFYNAPTINMFPIQRFMDFVSIGEVIEGIAKAFGEDKAATHEKVDVSLSDEGGSQNQIENMVLESPRACFFTIASDNDKIDFRTDYEELRKRVIVLDTDASEELTRRIQKRQAEIRSGRYTPRIDDDGLERIRSHHNNIPITTFVTENGGGEFKDIVSEPLVMQEPIPAKFVEGRYDNQKLMEMTSGVTLFHHDRRMKIPNNVSESGKHQLVTAPVDAFYGMKIFGENMVLSALNLKELDKIILRHLRDNPNENFSTIDLQSVVRAEGLNPGEGQIRSSLEGMREKTYVQKQDDSGRVKYRVAFLGQQIALRGKNIIDWEQLVEDTKEVARDVLSDKWAERYISEYCEGDGLIATHPLTGEEVDITESNEFEEEVNDALEEQGEEFDKPLFGEEEEEDSETEIGDSGNEQPENKTQATL